jgi:biopolymer transport protein ExbD
MNFRGFRMRDEPEINFIPLIDVLLVILIFLMVSTTYQRIRELEITLPEATAAQPKNQPNEIVVGVSADGVYQIGNINFRFSDLPTLAQQLRAAAKEKDPVVIIYADAKATHQSVIRVMEAAQVANFTNITFATNEPSK